MLFYSVPRVRVPFVQRACVLWFSFLVAGSILIRFLHAACVRCVMYTTAMSPFCALPMSSTIVDAIASCPQDWLRVAVLCVDAVSTACAFADCAPALFDRLVAVIRTVRLCLSSCMHRMQHEV